MSHTNNRRSVIRMKVRASVKKMSPDDKIVRRREGSARLFDADGSRGGGGWNPGIDLGRSGRRSGEILNPVEEHLEPRIHEILAADDHVRAPDAIGRFGIRHDRHLGGDSPCQ